MRFQFFLFLIIILYTAPIHGQDKCLTDAYHSEMMSKDKNYSDRYNALEKIKKVSNQRVACGSTIIIPVAIHFNDPIDCSDLTCLLDIVEAQIDVLNEDFLAANTDYQDYLSHNMNCSSAYPLSTAPIQNEGACVQFCLARTNHPVSSGLNDGDPAITIGFHDWPSAPDWDGYLNIFVSNSQGGLGLSPLPGSANGDGFWVTNTSFGGPGTSCSSGGNLNTSGTYNLGRTTTHEAGHYLGLPHVFGGNCSGDPDSNPPGPIDINDTPNQNAPFFGTVTINNCGDVPEECSGQPTSFFSFMDYTDDSHMVIFTSDQSEVINWHANDIPFKSNTTYCDGTYGPINCVVAASCSDGIQNQDEQDVDCGGTQCTDCISYCGKDFFDPGGPLSNYSDNSFNSWTFCPDLPLQILTINFTSWNVENNTTCSWDEMIIYDGPDDSAPQLGSWCTNSPGTVSSSTSGGCLHITFESDFSVNEEGWEATISCSMVLPVDLIDFRGENLGFSNILYWSTATESQNEGFFVERSKDGKQYESVDFIEGKGNSVIRTDYRVEDLQLSSNTKYYYRLKQVDFNGTATYSKVIQIKTDTRPDNKVLVFPNPVSNDFVNINVKNGEATDHDVTIYSPEGRLMISQTMSNRESTIDLKELEQGIYFIIIEKQGERILTKQLIKIE